MMQLIPYDAAAADAEKKDTETSLDDTILYLERVDRVEGMCGRNNL